MNGVFVTISLDGFLRVWRDDSFELFLKAEEPSYTLQDDKATRAMTGNRD